LANTRAKWARISGGVAAASAGVGTLEGFISKVFAGATKTVKTPLSLICQPPSY